MILIKIDPKSVRRNPKYNPDGFTHTIPGNVAYNFTFIGRELPNYLDSHCNILYEDRGRLEVQLNTINEGILEKMMDDDDVVDLQMHREIIDVSTLPGDPYLYDYIITVIQCLNCNLVFPHVLLRSDSQQTEDGDEFYSDEICPHCGDWDCCDIEFEKFSEKELEILANENKGTTQ